MKTYRVITTSDDLQHGAAYQQFGAWAFIDTHNDGELWEVEIAEQQVAAILAELREQAARNQEVGYPDAVVHLQAAEAAVHAAAGLGSPDERLREALALVYVMLTGAEPMWAEMPLDERCARAANEAQQAFLAADREATDEETHDGDR
jgi:hypothetical protein